MDKQLLQDIANMSDEELIQFRNGIKIGLANNVGVPERTDGYAIITNGLYWNEDKISTASLDLISKEVEKKMIEAIKKSGLKRGCRS